MSGFIVLAGVGLIAGLVVLGVVVLVLLWAVVAYNGLIRLKFQVKNGWAQIDVQLKRRYDLIPNLIETAKGYMSYEKETLEEVTKARNLAMQKGEGEAGVEERAQAEGMLNRALSQFFVVVERYPDLKANENMSRLMEELTATENKIAFARQFYNDTVTTYNTRQETIPTNIIAAIGPFKHEALFEVEEGAREAPKVDFSS
jgi:LemA protein